MCYMWINKNLVHQVGDKTKDVHLVGTSVLEYYYCARTHVY